MYTPPDEIVPVKVIASRKSVSGFIRKGINQAARDLGVSRPHLWFVLNGKRESKALMERIRMVHPELLSEAIPHPTQPTTHP